MFVRLPPRSATPAIAEIGRHTYRVREILIVEPTDVWVTELRLDRSSASVPNPKWR